VRLERWRSQERRWTSNAHPPRGWCTSFVLFSFDASSFFIGSSFIPLSSPLVQIPSSSSDTEQSSRILLFVLSLVCATLRCPTSTSDVPSLQLLAEGLAETAVHNSNTIGPLFPDNWPHNSDSSDHLKGFSAGSSSESTRLHVLSRHLDLTSHFPRAFQSYLGHHIFNLQPHLLLYCSQPTRSLSLGGLLAALLLIGHQNESLRRRRANQRSIGEFNIFLFSLPTVISSR